MNKIGTIEFEVIKGYDRRADLVKIREAVDPSNDGLIYLSYNELAELYKRVFNSKQKKVDNLPDVDLYDTTGVANDLFSY